MLHVTLTLQTLFILSIFLRVAAEVPSCASPVSLIRTFEGEEGVKIVLMGGNYVNIVYEDRDDIELVVHGNGVLFDETNEGSLVAIDVRAGEGDGCVSNLFCRDNLRCGSGGTGWSGSLRADI